jgi:hypothetical protein
MEALVRRLTVGILANSATRSPAVTSEWSHRSEQWFPASKVVIGAHPAMARESWNGGVGTQVDGRNSCEFRYEEPRRDERVEPPQRAMVPGIHGRIRCASRDG